MFRLLTFVTLLLYIYAVRGDDAAVVNSTVAAPDGVGVDGGDVNGTEAKGRSLFPSQQDPCSPSPCPAGTTCRSTGFGQFLCERPVNQDACGRNPCPPGSRCETTSYGYKCHPLTPPADPCSRNPCGFGQQCVRTGYNGFQCNALPTRSPCESRPCLNGGACIPTTGGRYRCQCTPGFTGSHCEGRPTIINNPLPSPSPCFPNPCTRIGCQCVESCRHSSGYYCRNNENGYLGKNCTIPAPIVRCEATQVIVTVDDAFVREYDMGIKDARLLMAKTVDSAVGQDCYSTYNGIAHSFTVPLPFAKCGTEVSRIDGDKTKVVNNIWLNRITNGRYDMPVPVICFECTYTKEYSFVTSLQPAIDQIIPLRETGIIREQGTIELCKVANTCPNSCPPQYAVTQGAVYTVGELLHVIIRGGPQGVLAVQNLHLSCDGQQSSASVVVRLVENGCPTSVRTRDRMPAFVHYSGRSSAACVSFQVPRLQGCATFYIHAQMESCGNAGCTLTTICDGRFSGLGRKRREAKIDRGVEDIYGPIYFIEGSRGIPNEILFPDRNIVDTPAQIIDPPPNRGTPGEVESLGLPVHIIVTASVLFAIFVIAVAAVVVLRGGLSKFAL